MRKGRVFFVGIIEDENENTMKYIERLLLEEEWEAIYGNKEESIVGLSKDKTVVFLINTQPGNLELYHSLDIKFDIILYNNDSILDYRFLQCDYFILNSDEEDWLKLPLDQLRPLVISYGFNNRATVTVSSYSDAGDLSVNIYLQREVTTLFQNKLEPFEFTINVEKDPQSKSETVIYKILGAVTTSLILDNKKSHMNIKI